MAGLESQNFALQWLSRLYLNTHLSDIAMTIDDEKIPCHRIVLAASSPYFEQCLFGERFMGDELMLDTSKESFLAALKFMYTGAVDIDRIDEDPVIDLFSLSHLLQIRPLVSLVEARLNAIEISANNVGKMYSVVSANNADTLLNKCWQFIEQNSENVITDMVTFSKFPYDLILEIVKRDTFFAAEIDIFHALVNWRKNNGNVDLTEVLNFLRLELIDAFSFNTHIRSTKLLSDDQYFNAHVKKPFGPRRKPEIPSTSNESELNKVHNENTESLQSPSNLDEKVDVLSFDNVNTSESCSCAQIPQNTPNSEDLLSLSAVLLECNMNGVKFWALWEITNSTILESERYCPMLLAEDGIQILKQLSLTNQMIDLNNLLMNQIEKWQKEQMIDENAKSERNECD
ncbi:uncharacterized protein B4U79_16417 [Dinothrombium tinctorium]|uniref:BTB domain-containing protein n=1 Tax=Dinothrombium tinctorium TaxID=1965070 RepID=A0A443QMX4_9ACAR|nr:uncharacterized protein B4U79_16417 [Dinothrombium tinctorium]